MLWAGAEVHKAQAVLPDPAGWEHLLGLACEDLDTRDREHSNNYNANASGHSSVGGGVPG
jgi:hypothetical protein